ncbi:DUF2938 family protein [Nissabacter sp. SGAir0207]|uniref:DUF2938 family protein n=1 Tax=Nissabacter sp. SGAir0207 TaxID=2126321 RepID=UPI0010CD29CC|nr:DUF2938 family protein [Nissabacter sp. SGAir0207]QCR35657.1 DUF2938 domain-containing protein [Nissabacter sp. SGAir0207]
MDLLLHTLAVGAGATLVMDMWAVVQRWLFATPSLDYALVGRWALGMARGQFCRTALPAAAPEQGERPLGWLLHYGIGMGFALALVGIAGPGWLAAPTPGPALLAGLLALAAPWLVMQPAWGLGIAGAKLPAPAVARRRSLITHLVFGLGLWLSACLLRMI